VTPRAIVTGASRGIGAATARLLAAAGCEVVLAARGREALEALAGEIGPTAHAFPVDVTDREGCLSLVEFARSLGPARPVLVNNAGLAEFGDFATMPLERIERQIEVGLLGPLYLTHGVVPWMLAEGGGAIVNVLSVTANHVFPGAAGYGTAKAGLHMLGRIVAAEYRRQGIRVTNILPGAVDTPLWDTQSFVPNREDMLPPAAVAEAIRDVVFLPPDRAVDEIHLMPPKGVL
jgi:NAD(P)-dependent dehydrogenase (short-subunit alcohol dehydrogenase family)